MEKLTLQGNLYYGMFKGQVLAHKPHGIIKLFVPGITPLVFDSETITDEKIVNKYVDEKNTKNRKLKDSSYNNVNLLSTSIITDNDEYKRRKPYIESLPDAHPALGLFGGTGAYNHTYSYPHIGSWVWCFFEGGKHTNPVYFASVPGGQYAKYEYNEILNFNDDPNNITEKENEIPKNIDNITEYLLKNDVLLYNQYNHRRHSFVTGKNKVILEEDGRVLIEVGYVPDDKLVNDNEQNVPYTEYTTPYGNNLSYKPVKPKSQESKTIIEICQSNISIKVPKSRKEDISDKNNTIKNVINLSQNIEDNGPALQNSDNYNRTYTLSKNIEKDFKQSFNTYEKIKTVGTTPLANLNKNENPEEPSNEDNNAYYEAVINIDCENKINIKCPNINVYSDVINAYNSDKINLVNGNEINIDNGKKINVVNGNEINVTNKSGDINVTNSNGNISVTNNNGNITTENTNGDMKIVNKTADKTLTIQSPIIEINGGEGAGEKQFGVIKIKGDIIHSGKIINTGNIMVTGIMDLTGDIVIH